MQVPSSKGKKTYIKITPYIHKTQVASDYIVFKSVNGF